MINTCDRFYTEALECVKELTGQVFINNPRIETPQMFITD